MKYFICFLILIASPTFAFSQQTQIRDPKPEALSGSNPLFIIDGKVVPSAQIVRDSTQAIVSIESLDPSEIQSIDVLKDVPAVEKYGEAGRNGVVVITTIAFARKSKKP
jgi:outer membrane receptor for ferrienterochelin and colicin